MLVYLCSPTLSQISLTNFFGKMSFQILAKIQMMGNKIGYLAAILKFTTFKKNNPELWFFIVHIYVVQISLQNSDGKMVFLGGPWNPRGHQREWKYLGHLSVNND